MAVAPPGSVRDAAGVSTKAERKMRVLAADTLHKSMVADIGVRPAMLPKEVSILKTQNGMTLPGFERPKGRDAEDLFGAPHPGGPVKRERVLEPAIYAASAASGLFCCSVMHLITVPVDVIKTRMQSPSFAGRYKGLRSGLSQVRWFFFFYLYPRGVRCLCLLALLASSVCWRCWQRVFWLYFHHHHAMCCIMEFVILVHSSCNLSCNMCARA